MYYIKKGQDIIERQHYPTPPVFAAANTDTAHYSYFVAQISLL
jgi:hypothetical protein